MINKNIILICSSIIIIFCSCARDYFHGHYWDILHVTAIPEKDIFITIDEKGYYKVWNVNGQYIQGNTKTISDLYLIRLFKNNLIGLTSDSVRILDGKNDDNYIIEPSKEKSNNFSSLEVMNDYLLIGDNDGNINYYSIKGQFKKRIHLFDSGNYNWKTVSEIIYNKTNNKIYAISYYHKQYVIIDGSRINKSYINEYPYHIVNSLDTIYIITDTKIIDTRNNSSFHGKNYDNIYYNEKYKLILKTEILKNASVMYNSNIEIYTNALEYIRTLKPHQNGIRDFTVIKDRVITVGLNDKRIKIMNMNGELLNDIGRFNFILLLIKLPHDFMRGEGIFK